MRLNQIRFCSLLSYCPHGRSSEIQHSKQIMIALKTDAFVEEPPIAMSDWVARAIQGQRTEAPFAQFFDSNTVLIPTPRSSLMRRDSLWVPHRIATALVREGIGKEVMPCLVRVKPVPKAAFSAAEERPTVLQHYKTMEVQGRLIKPEAITLVDDIVTRGATLLGAANLLADIFPEARISAFAAMRTISNSSEFKGTFAPCDGTIRYREESGDTLRRP